MLSHNYSTPNYWVTSVYVCVSAYACECAYLCFCLAVPVSAGQRGLRMWVGVGGIPQLHYCMALLKAIKSILTRMSHKMYIYTTECT